MFRRVLVLLAILFFVCPSFVVASENGVVINSYQISGQNGAKDEFVEILNTGTEEVDLAGWRLSKKTASGSNGNLVTSFSALVLAPAQKLVIAHPDCGREYEQEYVTTTGTLPDSSLAADNSIVLYSDNGKTIVDVVGFGDIKSDFLEGKPAPNPEEGEIYSRRKGVDTNDNKADFYLSYKPPIPKEVEKPEQKEVKKEVKKSSGPVARLLVTEFLPNPEGSDAENEFIEIYNAGSDADIAGYYITDLVGSPKKYKFPEGTTIKKGQYLAFYSAKTPISLNNSGDGVAVYSPDDKELSASPDDCGKAPEGASYAFDGKSWVWTEKPTPAKANSIKSPKDDKEEEGEVLGLLDDGELPAAEEAAVAEEARTKNDQFLGYALIFLAIFGGIAYTLFTYREKIVEFTKNKFGSRNNSLRERLRKIRAGR